MVRSFLELYFIETKMLLIVRCTITLCIIKKEIFFKKLPAKFLHKPHMGFLPQMKHVSLEVKQLLSEGNRTFLTHWCYHSDDGFTEGMNWPDQPLTALRFLSSLSSYFTVSLAFNGIGWCMTGSSHSDKMQHSFLFKVALHECVELQSFFQGQIFVC